MFKNYLIVAWRNLWKHRVFSLINLLGLTVSICVSLVVFEIVRHELSYDKYHRGSDRIYRVVTRSFILEEEYPNPGVPIPLADLVKNNLAGIEESAGFFRLHDYTVTIPIKNESGEKILKHQNNLVLTGPDYFRLFKHHWLAGNPETSLNQPFQVVLSENKAKSYFGTKNISDVLGREIIYRDSIQVVVTGILKETDRLTDFDFDEFISISTVTKSSLKDKWYLEHWDNVDSDFQLMVKLNEGVSQQDINDQFITLRSQNQENYELEKQINELQPLSDLHFNPMYGAFVRPVANRSTLMGLVVMALLIIILGSINYINLTTARGNQRAAEIGIRKTLGGSRRSLALRFITETVLISFIASVFAVLIKPLVFDLFHDFLPDGFTGTIWTTDLLPFLLALCLSIGILSGIYPGLILSSYQPISMVQPAQKLQSSNKSIFQVSLTVVQFAVATFFVASTWIVVLQLKYALTHEMGFDKEGILTLLIPDDEKVSGSSLIEELRLIPEIDFISRGGSSPAATTVQSRGFNYDNGKEIIETHAMLKYGDAQYLDVYGLQLLAGRNISHSDTLKELIINETFVKRLGFNNPSQAIGKSLSSDGIHLPIVGVVADFNTQPIHVGISPTIITNAAINSNVHIRLMDPSNDSDVWARAIHKIQIAWNQFYANEPFDFEFYDQRIASWYQQDQRTAKLLTWITGIAILISCLGLLGLVILITVNRTKEIAIRKVLGANLSNAVILLTSGLFKLILIAAAVAIPISWIFVSRWLGNYAYSIQVSWWMFVLPALFVLVVALTTISVQVIRVALANPVESLKYE